jgi:small-conductance mechanosensitive channel
MFQVANHVSQASRLAIVVYLVDCLTVVLTGLGFDNESLFYHHHPHTNLSSCFAKILYIAWAAQRLSVFKRYLLGRVIHKNKSKHRGNSSNSSDNNSSSNSRSSTSHTGDISGVFGNRSDPGLDPRSSAVRRNSLAAAAAPKKALGQAAIIDRLVDGIIYVVTGLFLLDILNVEMGVGVSSIFAFGSAGTLIMGLASKDVASMFVSGLTLATTDHVREGDHVKFGDGTAGQIVRIGWMHTTIRGYDELVEVVRHPNALVARSIPAFSHFVAGRLPLSIMHTDPQFNPGYATGQEHFEA